MEHRKYNHDAKDRADAVGMDPVILNVFIKSIKDSFKGSKVISRWIEGMEELLLRDNSMIRPMLVVLAALLAKLNIEEEIINRVGPAIIEKIESGEIPLDDLISPECNCPECTAKREEKKSGGVH